MISQLFVSPASFLIARIFFTKTLFLLPLFSARKKAWSPGCKEDWRSPSKRVGLSCQWISGCWKVRGDFSGPGYETDRAHSSFVSQSVRPSDRQSASSSVSQSVSPFVRTTVCQSVSKSVSQAVPPSIRAPSAGQSVNDDWLRFFRIKSMTAPKCFSPISCSHDASGLLDEVLYHQVCVFLIPRVGALGDIFTVERYLCNMWTLELLFSVLLVFVGVWVGLHQLWNMDRETTSLNLIRDLFIFESVWKRKTAGQWFYLLSRHNSGLCEEKA